LALVATIITYNDIETIENCIDSVKDKVDRIVIIDGKYRDFPGKYEISADGTVEYIGNIAGDYEITFRSVERLDEVAKRNVYLAYLKNGDICLNLDADEMLTGNIPKLEADIGIIQIGEYGDRKRHRRTNRFFRYRDGLHYWGKHSLILDADGKVFANLDRVGDYTSQKITEFELLHRNDLRNDKRKIDKKIYYKTLKAREAKINVPATR